MPSFPTRRSSDLVAWEATADQAEALLASGGGLAGLDVLLRAGGVSPTPGDLLRRLQQKGARAGVLLVSSDATAGIDAEAYVLKTRATELRSQQPDILIGL